ncbi:MAG: YcjF family protein, partial [Bellilinea sp.]
VSAVIALTPLPFIDFAPLAITQSAMVLSIARIYNYRITFERARELVVTFGVGFLGRTLFYELSKFGGVPGWLLGAAIASSTTVVMGYASVIWFERGEKLSAERIKTLTKTLTSHFLEALKGMGKKRPSRKSLQTRMQEAVQEISLGEDRRFFDDQVKDQPSNSG